MSGKTKNKDVPEEQEILETLNSSFYNISNRTKMDRYREFRQVFFGSDEGKRVFYEILSLARVSARLVDADPLPIDTNRLLVREGARSLAIDIMQIVTREPQTAAPMTTARRK